VAVKDVEEKEEIPSVLVRYQPLFLAGWWKEPQEVIALGSGIGEGTFGQVGKGGSPTLD
jgi:hypothetical protein